MSKKDIISNIQHKNKRSIMGTSNGMASKDSKETLIHSSDIDVSVNANVVNASTSNKRILLLETEKKHNKAFYQNYPDIKNNNKCENASNNLDKHDKSCIQKNALLSIQNNSKNSINTEIINNSDKIRNSKTDIKIVKKNKVPMSSKLVISQNIAQETELIPVCNSNASDTIAIEKNDIKRIKIDSIPKTFSKKQQQRKINDCITSSNLSQKIITDDNVLSTKIQDKIVKEQCTLPNKKTMTGNQRVDKIKSKITATSAKSTSSLPSDLSFIEDNNDKKLKLVKIENNLPVSAQLSKNKMQLDDKRKLIEECVVYDQEKLVKQQISSKASHDATDLMILNKDACETTEIKVKHNEYNQLSVPSIVKRKRGRPRKNTSIKCIDQNIPQKSKNDDTLQEIPSTVTKEFMTRSKRCTNKINITTNISDLSDESDIADIETFVKKRGHSVGRRGRGRKRGRGRGRGIVKKSLDKEYIPYKSIRNDVSQSKTVKSDNVDLDDTNATGDLLGTNAENDAIDSNITNEKTHKHLVTCSRCNQQIPKKQWSSHNLHQHNNMAWKEDEKPLNFENDVKLLKKVLTYALKKKKTYLTCEKCGATKRSVQGFISHMQFCGKSEEERQALMVTCPICNSVMMPSSMEIHERYHRQLEKNKNKETLTIQTERTKRKAAEKAVPKILEFTKSMKDPCTTNQTKLNHSTLKNLIQMPELKKKIPSIWKSQWKKELTAKGITSCKQQGCTYTCSSYENICEHYSQCNFTPQENFICKICKFLANSQDKIIDHVMEIHPNKEDLEKYSDFEKDSEDENSSDESIVEFDVKQKHRSSRITQTNSDSTRTLNKMAFIDQVPFQKPQSTKIYKPSLHLTMKFEQKNYELMLFNDLVPNPFTLLRSDDAAKYLPELTTSMSFKHANANSSKKAGKSDNSDWKRMGRFESNIYEDVPTFFVGGPVWALAWLPIPSLMYTKNPTQYIAISTHPTMKSEYTIGEKYSGPNIIQIWDIGSLDHEVKNINKLPTLAYAIAHNSGTVWCLEWCPSGCYQDINLYNSCKTEEENKLMLKRMGLLAAACSDGCVNIYSLPFAEELKFKKTEHNSWPIYKTDPVITLVVNHLMYDNNKQNWQCTKLSWTKERGHSIIAAGFSNGYIALWHLTITSFLLLNVQNNTKFINASQHFFAHHNAVTMVALIPYMNSRYLASASLDKSYKFWDLEDTNAPQNTTKKGIITDGIWMTNWPCAVLSFDDALGYKYTHSYVIPLREYGYKYCPILPTNTPTYGITVSDYANSIAHGTLAGEVITIFPHQLLYLERLLPKKRQLSSYIEIVDFLEEQQDTCSKDNENKNDKTSKDYHYMPETYNECKNRFGIIFHNNLTDLKKNISKGEDTLDNNKLMSFPIEQYPFTSANKVAWNPNIWSYLWLIVGYQNGLVRLLNLKHMSTSNELNNSLSSHMNHLLTKGNNSI